MKENIEDKSFKERNPDPVSDPVNHPKHYERLRFCFEPIDLCEAYNFNVGNAIKYILRAFEEWGVVPKKPGGFQKEEKPEAVEQPQPVVQRRIHLMETKKKTLDPLPDPVFLNIPRRPAEEALKKTAGPAIKRRTVNFDHPED